ncbi:mitochondrial splicing system protein [Kluyveromyces marxianus]|nr:mitochondrial splicing system protein [Kluyveromyces marxianus]
MGCCRLLSKPVCMPLWRRQYSVPATYFHPTVYALSTPSNQHSAIAILRISGTHSKYILEQLAPGKHVLPRKPMLRTLSDPKTSTFIDEALVLYFPQPKTFTGEELVELHLHGGKAIIKAALKSIQELRSEERDIRMAMPGEFSRRAFQNGKMDLLKLESINKMIHSDTEIQRLSALHSDEILLKFQRWRQEIIDQMAKLTAIIDFGEDIESEDIDTIIKAVNDKLLTLHTQITRFVTKLDRMSVLNDGIKLTLLGEPNSGKSSLINEISHDEVAIVSNIPGTTRDSIDVVMDINGFKCILTDTAGIRQGTSDAIEIKGIDRSKKKSLESNLVVLVIDASKPNIDQQFFDFINNQLAEKPLVVVLNKSDLITSDQLAQLKSNFGAKLNALKVHTVSCLTKQGLDSLVETLTDNFKHISATEDEDPIAVSDRVKEILQTDLLYGLDQFFEHKDQDILIACEALRIASDGIGKITGENIDVEEVLDVVFSKFCIGK